MRLPALALAALTVASGGVAAGRAERAPAAFTSTPVDRIEVLAINGGGTASSNYQSHLLHVRGLVDVCGGAVCPPAASRSCPGTAPIRPRTWRCARCSRRTTSGC